MLTILRLPYCEIQNMLIKLSLLNYDYRIMLTYQTRQTVGRGLAPAEKSDFK